ncbi:Holliday junction branch migration protein RuvA [Pseudomonadota bacterium]
MIGFLRGDLALKQPPLLILDVQGVGYELEAPMSAFYELPEVGQKVILYTHFVVREDAQLLYAFTRVGQRDLFRNLLKVNGVGPRVALAILSGLSAEEFAACIYSEDVDQITRIPGIGRKTAQRLIVEMKDKLENSQNLSSIEGVSPTPTTASSAAVDAISALINLGYKSTDATRAVRAIKGESLSSEDLIRLALRNISVGAS